MKIFNNIRNIHKAYVEGIYADTYQNRKLGRVGMTYAVYSEKLKQEEENKKEKKNYHLVTDDGEHFTITEGKVSKDKIIEEAIKYAISMVENNNYPNGFKFDIEENTEDWSDEDFKTKKWDWIGIKAKKVGSKVEISVYDWNTNSYIRNDEQDRINKEFEKKQKEIEEKSKQEFQEKFGWMEELLEYKKEKREEAEEWSSVIKYKEDRELARKAAEIFLQLGVKLPKLQHKPIPKQNNFQPISGYDKYSDTIIVTSSLNVTKKGKEYKEKGWNSQDNPILHELIHYLAYKVDPNGYSKEDFNSITKEEREKIAKEVSTYASWNQKEFNAELIAGILSGKKYSKEIMSFSNLNLNLDGKTPKEILQPSLDFYFKSEEMLDRIFKRKNKI